MSKLTECVVTNESQCHMTKNNFFPQLQSPYCFLHSTETALLKVTNDVFMNMDKEHVSLFLLLDLSAAFNTIDRDFTTNTLDNAVFLKGRSQRIGNPHLNMNNEQKHYLDMQQCILLDQIIIRSDSLGST